MLPYPTNLLGDYGNTTSAVVVYAITVAATALANTSIWWYTARAGLLDPRVTPSHVLHGVLRGTTFAAVFLLSIPVAFATSPHAAEITWGLMFVATSTLRRRYGSISDPFAEPVTT